MLLISSWTGIGDSSRDATIANLQLCSCNRSVEKYGVISWDHLPHWGDKFGENLDPNDRVTTSISFQTKHRNVFKVRKVTLWMHYYFYSGLNFFDNGHNTVVNVAAIYCTCKWGPGNFFRLADRKLNVYNNKHQSQLSTASVDRKKQAKNDYRSI